MLTMVGILFLGHPMTIRMPMLPNNRGKRSNGVNKNSIGNSSGSNSDSW